jgi:hypothetical protein
MSACGCRSGYYLCPEAERLWARVGDAFRLADRTQMAEDWAAYDCARAEYGEHMDRAAEAKEVGDGFRL